MIDAVLDLQIRPALLVALSAAVLALALLYLHSITHRKGALRTSIPRAPGELPLLSHALTIMVNYHIFDEWLQRVSTAFSGKTWCFTVPLLRTYVVTNHPRNVEHILKTNFNNYIKGSVIGDAFHQLLGDGIFVVDGDSWYMQRKTAARIFTERRFRSYVDGVFADKLVVLLGRLDTLADTPTAIDVHDLLHRYTLESFCKIGFSYDLDYITSDSTPPFALAFHSAQEIVEARFWTPLWQLGEVLTGKGRRLRQDVGYLNEFCGGIVNKRLGLSAAAPPQSDLLEMFIEAIRDKELAQTGGDGQSAAYSLDTPSTRKLLADIVLNFIIAGRDTTAQSLSWTLYYLALHPNCQEQLLQEVRAANMQQEGVEEQQQPDVISYTTLKQLRYTRAVFSEALRLQPSVPRNGKLVAGDDTLPDGTQLPGGCCVMWSLFTMSRDPEIWGADAAEFRPERWLQPGSARPSPYSHPVFNAGPRTCLGQTMAEAQATLVLAEVLRRYRLELVPDHPVERTMSVTNPMKHGLMVTVHRR